MDTKPVPSPAKEVMEDLAAERDELASRLDKVKLIVREGNAADARRRIARVLTSLACENADERVFAMEQLAVALDFVEAIEGAEEILHAEVPR